MDNLVATRCRHGKPLHKPCQECADEKVAQSVAEAQAIAGTSTNAAFSDLGTPTVCRHGKLLDKTCLQCGVDAGTHVWETSPGGHRTYMGTGTQLGYSPGIQYPVVGSYPSPEKSDVSAAFSAPETLTAQLRRLRFELQTTQTRLAEADKVIEKVLASL